jgi:hypothetical protein
MTSCDLGHGHWRLVISAVPMGQKAALGLAIRYPPPQPFLLPVTGQPIPLGDYAQWVFATAPIDIAESPQELVPVAQAALERGSLEADKERTTEAMNLFRNKPRLREETFQACLRDTLALLDGYWSLVAWFQTMPREPRTLMIADAQLVLEP